MRFSLRLGLGALLAGPLLFRPFAARATPNGLPDIAHLGAAPEIVESFLKGFHSTTETVSFAGQDCTVHFVLNSAIGKEAPVLLLHGITDTGSGFSYYVTSLIRRGLPYKNLVWLDLPRHGLSKCEQVTSFQETAKAVQLAFEKLRADNGLSEPKAILGHSIGVVLSAYLHDRYPKAHLTWVSNPVLNAEETEKVRLFVTGIDSRDGAKEFLARVGKDPIPQIPLVTDLVRNTVYDAMKDRLIRVRPLMLSLDLDGAVKQMTTIAPALVDTILARDDLLTPPRFLHPALVERFNARTKTVVCGHNIHRDCPRSLPERF